MAAQLYSNTRLAECLYEVLQECVGEGMLTEELAAATLAQLDQVNARVMSCSWHACPLQQFSTHQL